MKCFARHEGCQGISSTDKGRILVLLRKIKIILGQVTHRSIESDQLIPKLRLSQIEKTIRSKSSSTIRSNANDSLIILFLHAPYHFK